jgi:hypothetical protein
VSALAAARREGEMPEEARALRKKVIECVKMFLSGTISCDHLIEEFGGTDDPEVREIIRTVEEETRNIGRYSRIDQQDGEFKARMEALTDKLGGGL